MREEVEVGGGRKEEEWGGQRGRESSWDSRKKGGSRIGWIPLLLPAGYNREMEREAGEGRCRARAHARACTPM